MKVLISGAGPAGLSLAYWLKKYGYQPTLLEVSPALRTAGYKIDIRGAGLEVIRKMGLYDAMLKNSTDMQAAELVDKTGKVIKRMTGNDFGHRIGEDQEILRGLLCKIFLDQIPDVEILYDDCIQEIFQTENIVKVKFKKNEPRNFDLVIGADGLHSTVRRLVFGEEQNYSKEFGIYLCVFTIPNYLNLDRTEIQYTELGRMVAIWSTKNEPTARATFAFITDKKTGYRDISSQQQLLRSVFADLQWEVPKLLDLMSTASDFYFDSAAQIDMDHWSQGRVVLTGDAAYCASPLSGQGLSLALVGAYVLAGELAKAQGNYRNAFEQYEAVMRPYIKLNQALGVQSAKIFKSQDSKNPLAWFLSKLVNLAPSFMIEFFIQRATQHINRAANSIILKDYSSFYI